jgi:hypothetical protein
VGRETGMDLLVLLKSKREKKKQIAEKSSPTF